MRHFIEGSQSHRNSGRAKVLNARLCVVVSLWLLIGPTLSLGSIRLAKANPTQDQGPNQLAQIPIAVLSFQDESGTGASDEFCQRLGEHLMKKLYAVPNRTISPKSIRTKAGMELTQERLSALGKKMGVQFVVHSGLLGVSSDSAGGKRTSRAQVYADILSVEAAVMKRVEAEGVGAQKITDYDADIQLGSADFRSREFHNTSVGRALSSAIEQLAALINQEIGSGGVAPGQNPRNPLPDVTEPDQPTQDSPDVPPPGGEDDPGATGEAQEAQADEELQQLIAQAQECLNGLNAGRDKGKVNALIEALKGLTSALETKAGLLEQGNITGADQADQQIDAQEQQLQDAVEQSLPPDQPADVDPSDVDPGSGGSKFDQVIKYVEFGFSVLEKILELRARFRDFAEDPTLAGSYPGDFGPGDADTPYEEPLEPFNGLVFEDEGETQGNLTVERQDLFLAMLAPPRNARGPNVGDSNWNFWMPSATSSVGVVTTVAGRRRPVAGAEIVEPDSGASTRTDNSGFFTLRVPARSRKLIVKKGGATVAEVAIHVVRGRHTVADIQLGRSGRGATLQGARVLPSSVVVNREGRNTGTIRGVIQDAKGQPVPRAVVDVRGLAMARTDSQGRFSFTKVPAGLQQLTVRASDSESRSEQVRIKSNETTESRIQLALASRIPRMGDRLITPGSGRTLRGTVTDNQNRPVPGARISAVSTTGSGGAVSVRTRADGSFELGDLKPGSYQVLVDKVGLASASKSVSLREGSAPSLEFRLKKDATSPFRPGVEEGFARNLGEVRGQVRAKNGAPIPNAWIEMKSTGKTSPASPQRTSARGEYVLRALPGRYELRVRAKDYQETTRPVTVQAHDPRRENFDLKLTTGKGRDAGRLGSGALTGRVTDERSGRPISGARVTIQGRTDTTDQAGNYVLTEVPAGSYQASVTSGGYENEKEAVEVRAGSSTNKNFKLKSTGGSGSGSGGGERLRETGQLGGRVTDERSGRPISGARVTIQGRTDTTDQAGNYVLTEVPAGSYQASVTGGGYENEKEAVEVRAGSSTNKNFKLKSTGGSGSGSGSGSRERLRETGQLGGRVTDERTGKPISGARVTIQGRSDTTDQAGNYLVTEMPAGSYQASVTSGGYENEKKAVEVRAGSSTNKSFKLKSAGGSGTGSGSGSGSRERLRETGQLGGRVTDERTGRPISGARVTTQGRSDTTDQAGNYVVTEVPAGSHQVSVTSRGYENERESVEVRARSSTNKNFRLKSAGGSGSGSRERLRETGQLRGRVTDERTGKPISGARVTTQGRSDTTDQAGNYVVTEVPAGSHQVSVTSRGYENERESVEVRARSSTNKNFTLKSASGSRSKEHQRGTGQLKRRVSVVRFWADADK